MTKHVNKTATTPDYYHKVVDCQWACPAHTNVPEYIRLIAAGRYADSYLLNRESNVFPGILGRVCDRPCEPACRRGRLDEEPVAICRLKRVASDLKGDIRERLPTIPTQKNGKRVALIGAGPASLTVANDLMPLGYSVTLFEKESLLGGAMRSQVPGFRLPAEVLDDEIAMIVEMGVEVRAGSPVHKLSPLLADFDAVFVGTGAPIGRDLNIPGRKEAGTAVHVGLSWLANVAFEHTLAIEPRVVVIGGGNTAMDCCRTALRLGGKTVTVVAPEKYEEMLASPWEKDDAEAEGVSMRNNLLPESFIVENGRLVGVRFTPLTQAYGPGKKWLPVPSGEAPVTIPCDAVILAIGQNTAYPFIDEASGVAREPDAKGGKPLLDPVTLQSTTQKKVFFGGDAAFGPKNIIWAVAQGHEAAISIHRHCQGKPVKERLPTGMNLVSQKMGYHDWSYKNQYDALARREMPHLELKERLAAKKAEVELGFTIEQALQEAARCLNCDVQTVFTENLCIECDACIDICPLNCLTLAAPAPIDTLRERLSAPATNSDQALLVSDPLKTGRLMVKDEDLCIHCGLCAERCPTAAWDMQKFELILPTAGGGCP